MPSHVPTASYAACMTSSLAVILLLLVPMLVVAGIYGNGWLYAFLLAKLFHVRVRGPHRISWLPALATAGVSIVLGLFYLLSEPAGDLALGLATLVTSPVVVQKFVPDEAGVAIGGTPAWIAWVVVLAINLVMALVFGVVVFTLGIGGLAMLTR